MTKLLHIFLVGKFSLEFEEDTIFVSGYLQFQVFKVLDIPAGGSVAKKLLNRYYEINRNLRVYDMSVNTFKWKHFAGEIIFQTVRWHLKYPLSYKTL